LCKTTVAQHEPPNLIVYEPGQRFGLHSDFIDPDIATFQGELTLRGQRIVTCITYLNDSYVGGETQFPFLGLNVRGAVGDALVFSNVSADGTPDRASRHAGAPPAAGCKAILSQWVRNKPQLM